MSQSFANVNVEDDLTLSGSINGLNLRTLYQETIWRNTMQHVDLRTVVFGQFDSILFQCLDIEYTSFRSLQIM